MTQEITETKEHDIEKLKKYVENCKSEKFDEKLIIRRLEQSAVPKEIIDKVMNSEEKKEYSRDSDSITHEEMEKLKNKETSLIKKFKTNIDKFKSPKKNDEKSDNELTQNMPDSQISKKIKILEKAIEDLNISDGKKEGKIEILTNTSNKFNDDLENFSEKIGELRSTILSRERLFNKVEDDMNQVKYIVNSYKPELLEKKFLEFESQILKIFSTLEKDEMKEEKLEKQLKLYEEIMSKIKDYESVMNKLKELKKTEESVEKVKFDIERMNSKIEVLYHNIEDSINKINTGYDIAQNNQTNLKDVLVSISKIEQKIELLTKKEEFKNLQNDVHVLKKSLFMQEFNKPGKKGFFKR